MTITTLPTSPSRTSPSTIASRTQAFFEALHTFTTEANLDTTSLTSSTNSVASNYSTVSTNEALAASYEAGSDDTVNSLLIGGPANLWVSGTSYTIGANVKSPSNGFSYKRRTNGAGTTDPSADSTNWGLIGQTIETSLPSAYPSLNLNFLTEGPLDPRITFTRASGGTRINQDGVITLMGSNTPRIDYDGSTGVCKGLLIEESRTNLLLNSLISGINLSTQTVSVSATAYTLSFYGRGTVTLSGVYSGTLVGSGDYPTRSTLTFTPTAGSLVVTVTGDVKYAQLEAGSFATSFIPTAGSSVTRAADNASIIGANFTSWYNATEGVFIVQSSQDHTLDRYIIALIRAFGSFGPRIQITNSRQPTINNVNDSSVVDATIGTPTVRNPHKWSFAYKINDYILSAGGVLGANDTAVSIPTALMILAIGQDSANGNHLNGCVATISYIPKRLTNAEVQSLSTY